MNIYPVTTLLNGRIALAPCPKGGEALEGEISFLRQNGYRLVISMLTPEEQQQHGLTEEQAICERHHIGYLNYPIRDEVADSDEATLAFVHKVRQQIEQLADEENILFHCRGGVGRSSMMIALVLANDELPVGDIFAQLTKARGETTPESTEQLQWVSTLSAQSF